MAQNAGIDYGMGKSNIDHETGIRYGVINQNEVLQAWADSSEPDYGPPTCGHCGEELPAEYANMDDRDKIACPHCHEIILGTEDMYPVHPVAYTYDADGYVCSQSGDDTDIFVIKSPYYTYAQFCSPCAPGAGYLMSPFTYKYPNETGNYIKAAESAGFPRVYCFGHDWFEEGKAPYPVFSVETGEIVNP